MIEVKAPGHYLNQPGLLDELGRYAAPIGRDRVWVVTGQQAWHAAGARVSASLAAQGVHFQQVVVQGKCTRATIDRLALQAQADDIQLIIGLGGGRVLDIAKAVSESLQGLPLITVPTIAATCAAWSPVSVIYNAAGGHVSSTPLQRMPEWVLVDSQLLAEAPVRYLKAGIADALAKWYEFEPYLRHGDNNISLVLKAQAAKLALDIFAELTPQALADNQAGQATPALIRVIDAVIALAGMANSLRDEQPRIGVAHAIHNSVTHIDGRADLLHGELVGYGLRIQAAIDRLEPQSQALLLRLLVLLNMPATLEDIGIRPPLNQAATVERIAAGVKIPAAAAAKLPFDISVPTLQALLLQTARLPQSTLPAAAV